MPNKKIKKRHHKKKLIWISMQVSRVKLNPEQAVLACCKLPGKLAYCNPWNQCLWGCSGVSGAAPSS